MHLDVTFRNLRSRDEVRRRAEALFEKLERFLDPAATAQLVITHEHDSTVTELTVNTHGEVHQVQEDDEDLRTALDRAFHRVETGLRRSKERRIDRQHAGGAKSDGFEIGEDGEVKPVSV